MNSASASESLGGWLATSSGSTATEIIMAKPQLLSLSSIRRGAGPSPAIRRFTASYICEECKVTTVSKKGTLEAAEASLLAVKAAAEAEGYCCLDGASYHPEVYDRIALILKKGEVKS